MTDAKEVMNDFVDKLLAMKCEKCKKDIPLQHGFSTNSLVLKPRTANERIITPLCDECANDIFSVIDYWLNKKEVLKDDERRCNCDTERQYRRD